MRIGVGLPNQVHEMNPAVIPGWARRAEEAGFSSVGTLGRVSYPALMDTVALAAAAAATSRVDLFSTVTITPVWPPVLLAKELAGIDAVSGGRLTVGVGLGGRPDDYVAEGYPAKGLGRRLDADLEIYHRVWKGEPTGGGENPAVPTGTRPVPLIFGGTVAASFARMARWGDGYTSGGVPGPMVAGGFDAARDAWRAAGRAGRPRLVAMMYFALGDPGKGLSNIRTYYGPYAPEQMTKLVLDSVSATAAQIRETVQAFAAIGTDDLILHPTTDDPAEIERLAEVVLR
ncbi:LLM class flavin-dependent oxidoreductase [Actinoplanes sp. LDG1-06]|uniref:LLM class flavin-dependent oxidoreductase n=1 Tax=Paractinoplanes ovalisporus TaxID=2810368 RepID=A0ABS2AGR4_9ACTN|nr:LLM class flavin-dependent oxidoreductase [Actinoplanes ovalisporus]MBM2619021.1 LLM class flavin-dependent oxidoreductase [Actinoplanes ovalisporus]